MKKDRQDAKTIYGGVSVNPNLDDFPKDRPFQHKIDALEKAARETNLLEILRRPPAPLK